MRIFSRRIGDWAPLFFCLVMCHCPYISAQEVNPVYIQDWRLGGTGRDTDVNSLSTSDGGFILTASSLSGISGNKETANNGDDDWWIIKLNESGDKLWEINIGGSGEEGFEGGAAETPDGHIVFTGRTRSSISGDIQTLSLGGDDIMVIKIDGQNGNNTIHQAL